MISKLFMSVRQRGLLPTVRRAAETIPWQVRLFADRIFDRRYGVETSGLVATEDLGLSSASQALAVHYEPTPATAIRAMLRQLPIDHGQYTFVDYGSGKGRVLLVASLFPFRRIIGVEYSEALHQIAVSNVQKWRHPRCRCRDILSVAMNAESFVPPDGPLVLFFFTPFRPPISTTVVKAIGESLSREPRPIEILYYGMDADFVALLQGLDLRSEIVYNRRPLAALGSTYRGVRFTNQPR